MKLTLDLTTLNDNYLILLRDLLAEAETARRVTFWALAERAPTIANALVAALDREFETRQAAPAPDGIQVPRTIAVDVGFGDLPHGAVTREHAAAVMWLAFLAPRLAGLPTLRPLAPVLEVLSVQAGQAHTDRAVAQANLNRFIDGEPPISRAAVAWATQRLARERREWRRRARRLDTGGTWA